MFTFIALMTLCSARLSDLALFCPAMYNGNNQTYNWDVTSGSESIPMSDWYWNSDYDDKRRDGVLNNGKPVYPAGFELFTMYEFNEPGLCLHVPGSKGKKVEIMIESRTEDANICIKEASDLGVKRSDVGNVDTCQMGQLYACFTASSDFESDDEHDFSFYVYCNESCEASDVDLWIRVRASERTWEDTKDDVTMDLEMWCEMERGASEDFCDVNGENCVPHPLLTYPSELIDDNPAYWPFRIIQIVRGAPMTEEDKNSAAVAITATVAVLLLLGLAGCVMRNTIVDKYYQCRGMERESTARTDVE